MLQSYTAILYRPIYATLGVPAVITLPGAGSPLDPIAALDKTKGVVVGTNAEVQTVLPAACVMMADLAAQAVDPSAVDDGTIALNGRTWTIDSHRISQSPNGEADGELYLFLRM